MQASSGRHGSGHDLEGPWCGQGYDLGAAGQGKRTQEQDELGAAAGLSGGLCR